jgi:hypothetical protein
VHSYAELTEAPNGDYSSKFIHALVGVSAQGSGSLRARPTAPQAGRRYEWQNQARDDEEGLMPKMTPEAEARYALNFNIARSVLSIYTSELNP